MPGILTVPISPGLTIASPINESEPGALVQNELKINTILPPPVKLDTQLEGLSVLVPSINAVVNVRYKVTPNPSSTFTAEGANRLPSLTADNISIPITLQLMVGGLPVYLSSQDMNLQAIVKTIVIEKSIEFFLLLKYEGTIPIIADLTNPFLVLPGQEVNLSIATKYTVAPITTTNYSLIYVFNGTETESREVKTEISQTGNMLTFTLAPNSVISYREVSTLPGDEDETAPPRRVI